MQRKQLVFNSSKSTSFQEFHYQPQFVVLDKGTIICDNVWMLAICDHFHFFLERVEEKIENMPPNITRISSREVLVWSRSTILIATNSPFVLHRASHTTALAPIPIWELKSWKEMEGNSGTPQLSSHMHQGHWGSSGLVPPFTKSAFLTKFHNAAKFPKGRNNLLRLKSERSNAGMVCRLCSEERRNSQLPV